jgi:hypothetical protein
VAGAGVNTTDAVCGVFLCVWEKAAMNGGTRLFHWMGQFVFLWFFLVVSE